MKAGKGGRRLGAERLLGKASPASSRGAGGSERGWGDQAGRAPGSHQEPYLTMSTRAVRKGFTSYVRPCLAHSALTSGAILW